MAIKANLIIDQGTTFTTQLNLTDENDDALDLTNYSGSAQMRKHYTSSNSSSFTVSLGGNTGIVTLSMTANATANLTAGRYVYDLELTDGSNEITRIVEGIVTVTPNVTR